MAKYTEAYNDITNRNIDIMHVRKECAADPAAYERNYRGHLFCPGCGVVPLTLVHDEGRLYFRGHPNAVHPDRCFVGIQTQYILIGAFLCWMSTLSKILVDFAEKTKTTL